MTRAELRDLVANGEGYHLEFKYRVPEPERLAKELTALANADGGLLLIGVNDDGTLVGLKDLEEQEYMLTQVLRDHISPVMDVDLLRVRISRKRQVLAVRIPVSDVRPHYVVDRSSGRRTVFIRIQDKSVEASREARKLMRNAGHDQDILIAFRRNERKLLRYLEEHRQITVRQFARLANISRPHASHILVRLTRAKLLRHHPDLSEDYFMYGVALAENAQP